MFRGAVFAAALALLQPADSPELQLLNDWIRSVDEHVAGEDDDALARTTTWTRDELDALHAYLQVFVDLPTNTQERDTMRRWVGGDGDAVRRRARNVSARGDFTTFLKRAVMLHTDAATIESEPSVVAAPVARHLKPRWQRDTRERAVDVLSFDGRVERFQEANPHWQIAMDLLESLPAKPQRDPIVADWYRAVGALFAHQRKYADAVRHFDRARKIVPDDPGVLFGDACLQETLGSPHNQNFVRVTTLPNGLVILGVSSPEVHFRRAESLLKRALAARPDFVDARLRLGRALAELKQPEAALVHFRQVIAESRNQALTYYAHLFMGDAALTLGRADEARASYERALETYPQSQAAHLGLGAALRTLGDRPAALRAVLGTLTREPRSRDESDEPWWEYYEGDATNVDRLLVELRAPFRSAPQ